MLLLLILFIIAMRIFFSYIFHIKDALNYELCVANALGDTFDVLSEIARVFMRKMIR